MKTIIHKDLQMDYLSEWCGALQKYFHLVANMLILHAAVADLAVGPVIINGRHDECHLLPP